MPVETATAGKSGIPTNVVSTIKVAAPPANAQKSPVTGGKLEHSLHKQICVPFVKMKKVAARPKKISPPMNDLLKEISGRLVINLEDNFSFSVMLGFSVKESAVLEEAIGDNSVFSEDEFMVNNLIKIGSKHTK